MGVVLKGDRHREVLPLTGLRALAAWWVVWFHFARDLVAWWPLRPLVRSGHIAVDLFFVLSGFVLAHRYLLSDVEGQGRHAFWARRFARVYPLYLLSLAIGFAAEWPASLHDLTTRRGAVRLALQLALLNAWSHRAMFRLNWAAWSLSVEAFLYLLFPWILALLCRCKTRTLWAVVAASWAALLLPPALYGACDPDHLGQSLGLGDEVLWGWYLKFFPVQRLPEFVAGAAVSLLVRRKGVNLWIASAAPWGLGALLGGVLIFSVVPYAYLQAGALLPIAVGIVALVSLPGTSVSRALTMRPLVALGRASYATYILHVPSFLLAAHFYPGLWHDWAEVMTYMGALAALSLLTYHWIEEPLRRAIARRWATARASTSHRR